MPTSGIIFSVGISNPACLLDCYSGQESNPDHCITSLLRDVLTEGICNLPLYAPTFPRVWNSTGQPVYPARAAYPGLKISDRCMVDREGVVTRGTCSEKTKQLLHTLGCNTVMLSQQLELLSTFATQTYLANCTPTLREFVHFQDSTAQQKILKRVKRVLPVTLVNLKTMNKTKLNYRNTLHRYPWICSLRTASQPPKHLCAVTLLSLQPRVIVGPAHCTYVCKDGG